MKRLMIFTFCFLLAVTSFAQPPREEKAQEPPREIQDFKLRITFRGARTTTTGVAELVFRGGICYQFLSENDSAVTVIDWKRGTLTLLDLERRLKAVVTAKQLENYLGALYEESENIVATEEKSKSRSDRVSAEISRPLIDPNNEETFDAKTSLLTLKNRSVTIEMKGEAETDDARREAYASCLLAGIELGAMRDQTLLPPFTRLEAFKAMLFKHKLRPVEVSFLYRLAGPPQKIRMSYEWAAKLSDKETEAIAHIIKLDKLAKEVPLNEFDGSSE